MFDIIGKRRWFYIFSLLIMIPGLIFILLTPFSRRQGRAPSSRSTSPAAPSGRSTSATARPAPSRASRRSWPSRACRALSRSRRPARRNTCSSGPIQIGLTEFPSVSRARSRRAPTTGPRRLARGIAALRRPAPCCDCPRPVSARPPSPQRFSGGVRRAQPIAVTGHRRDRPARLRAGWPSCASHSRTQFGPIDEVRQEANIGPVISAELASRPSSCSSSARSASWAG